MAPCRDATEACHLGDFLLSSYTSSVANSAYDYGVALDPDHARSLAGRGLTLLRSGIAAGRQDLLRAHELDPDGLWPRLRTAQAALDPGGDPSQAKRLLDELLLDFPGNGPILRTRAGIRHAAGDRAGAWEDIAAALDDPSDTLRAEAFLARARMRSGQGDGDGAVEDLEQALALVPDYPTVYRALGEVHFQGGRYEQATSFLSRAIEFAPSNASAYQRRAQAADLLGRFESGRRDATVYRLLDPSPESWGLLAQLERRLGNLDEAVRCLNHSLLLDDQDPATWAELAELSLELGDTTAALQQSEWAVRMMPSNPVLGLVRLRILGELGRTPEALAEIERVQELDGLSPEVRVSLDQVEARLRAEGR